MSCPNRCSNDFKVKNFPDEIECVVADTIKGSTFQLTGPSSNLIRAADSAVDACATILLAANDAVNFTGTVLDASDNAVDAGTVLRLTDDGTLIVAL